MRKSSKNAAFSDIFILLVLVFFNKIKVTGWGREGASTQGYSGVCSRFIKCSAGVCRAVGQWVSSLTCRLVVFTHWNYLSIHRLKKRTSVRQHNNGNDTKSNCIPAFVYKPYSHWSGKMLCRMCCGGNRAAPERFPPVGTKAVIVHYTFFSSWFGSSSPVPPSQTWPLEGHMEYFTREQTLRVERLKLQNKIHKHFWNPQIK